jgi:hypothetical protein
LNSNRIEEGTAGVTDVTTLFELDVFSRIWSDPEYIELYLFSADMFVYDVVARDDQGEYIHRSPKIIGPDRGRVVHTTNTITSFVGESQTRPKYLNYIDIVGTQSRLGDTTSQNLYWDELVAAVDNGSVLNIWCTMCSNEWDRMPSDYLKLDKPEDESDSLRLRARYAGRNYWE